MPDIIQTVARECGVTEEDIFSNSRTKAIAEARSLCYWFGKQLTRMSPREIGKAMNRDNASVRSGIARVERAMKTDLWFRGVGKRVRLALESQRETASAIPFPMAKCPVFCECDGCLNGRAAE